MIRILKNIIYLFIFIFFKNIEILVWLMIQILPGIFIQKLIIKRPTLKIRLRFIDQNNNRVRLFFKNIIRKSSKPNFIFSTCLSRAITGRLILDFFNMPNILQLGLIINENGDKCPHAWLVNPIENYEYIPGIKGERKSCLITSFN